MKKREGIEAQRVKHSTLFPATGALIGDEEENGKQKGTKRKKQGAGPIPATLGHSDIYINAEY